MLWKTLVDSNINKNNIKPVLIMVSALLFFPLGFYLCALHYQLKSFISIIMTIVFIIIGLVLVINKVPITDVLYFLNMISFSFLFVYLSPLLNKKENTNHNKISIKFFRVFVMILYLLPASIIPLHMIYGGQDKVFIINDDINIYLSLLEMITVVVLSVIWYFCAAYSLFHDRSE